MYEDEIEAHQLLLERQAKPKIKQVKIQGLKLWQVIKKGQVLKTLPTKEMAQEFKKSI